MLSIQDHEQRRAAWLGALPLLVYAVAFLVAQSAAWLLAFAISPKVEASTPLFVQGAVVVSALLLVSPKRWWLYLLLTLPLIAVNAWLFHAVPSWGIVWTLLLLYLAIVSLAVSTAFLVRRFVAVPLQFASARQVSRFVLCVCSGAVLPACLVTVGRIFIFDWTFWFSWETAYFGYVLAIMVFTPAIVLWLRDGPRGLGLTSRQRRIELALLGLATVALGLLVFATRLPDQGIAQALVYVMVPVLIWAAIRFGPQGLASILAVVTTMAITGAAFNRGPFAASASSGNVVALQLFLLFVGVPLFFLAALVQERKNAAVALQASETRYHAVVETQTEMITRYSPDLTLTFVNDVTCRFVGKSREELLGTSMVADIPAEAATRVREMVEALLAQPDPGIVTIEHETRSHDGSLRWQQWVNRTILDDDGQVVELQGIGRDITERKQAAEALRVSEARYRTVVRNLLQTVVLLFDAESRHSFADGPGLQALGLTPEGLEGRTVWEAFPADLAAALTPAYEAARSGQATELDVEHEQHIYRIQVVPMPDAPPLTMAPAPSATGRTPVGMAVLRDITEQRRARDELIRERTLATMLSALSQEFRTLADHSPDFIARLDPSSRFLYINQPGAALLGLPPEQCMGKTFAEVGMRGDTSTSWDEMLWQVVETRTPRTFDAEVHAPDGQMRSLHVRLVPEFAGDGEEGALRSVLGIATDVSALKEAEARLVGQASELEAIFESQADGVAVYDLQGRFVRANSALRHLLGFDADAEYTALSLEERAQRLLLFDEQGQPLPPEQWPHWRVLRGEILAGASTMERRVRTVDGRELWISTTGAPVRAADGQVTGTVLITRDVTARRALEQQVAAQASELEAIFEAMADGILVQDVERQRIFANDAYRHLLRRHLEMRGHEVELDSLFAAPQSEWERHLAITDERGDAIPPDAWATERALRGEILTGESAIDEFMHGADGSMIQVSVSAAPVRNASRQVTGAVAVFRDVTARRELERQVREQAAQLETIFESQADGVGVYDLAGRFVRANRALRDLLGLDADTDYPSLPFAERARRLLLYDEQGQPLPLEQWPQWRVLRGEIMAGASAMEVGVRTLDGRDLWISITGAPMRSPDGQATGVVLIARDVTARRTLERQVAEQAAELEAIFEAMADGVLVHDAQGRVRRVNQAYRDLIGVEADPDHFARSIDERVRRLRVLDEQGHPLPEGHSVSRRVLSGEVVSGQDAQDVQMRALDSRDLWVNTSGAPIRAPDGQITGVVLISREVTARRALEQQVVAQASELEAIFEAMADGVVVYDREGRMLRANRARQAMFHAFANLDDRSADPSFAALPFAKQVERWQQAVQGRQYALRDVDGHAIPLEQMPTYRALQGETLTGANAVDERFDFADGNVYVVSVSAAPIRDAAGSIVGAVGVSRDVTAQRQLERQVRDLADELEAILDASPDVIAVLDQDQHIVRANRTLRQTIRDLDFSTFAASSAQARAEQLHLRDAQGRPLPIEDLPDVRALRGDLLADRTSVDVRVLLPDGRELAANIAAAPVYNREGHVTRAVAVWRDITERLALERRVAEQAAELEAIFAAMPDGVIVLDTQANVQMVNHAYRRLLGVGADPEYFTRSRSERAQRLEVFDEQGHPFPREQWVSQRILRGEVMRGQDASEVHVRAVDGREVWVNTSGAPIRAPDGRITGVVLVSRDVTGRRALERQVAEQASELEAIFEAQADVVVVYDQKGRFVRGNRAWEDFVHQSADMRGLSTQPAFVALPVADQVAWLNQRIQDEHGHLIAVEDRPTSRALRGETVSGSAAVDELYQIADGRDLLLSVSAAPVRDHAGRITGVVVVGRDVTDRRQLERQLAEREQQYRTLVESSPVIIARFDRAGRYLYVGTQVEAATGIPAQQLLGKTDAEVGLLTTLGLSAERYANWAKALAHATTMGEQGELEFEFTGPSGTHAYLTRFIPEQTAEDGGEVTSVLTVTTDVTTLKRTERALREANARLKTARREEERRKQIAESLRGVLTVLNSKQPPQEILQYIVRQAEELLGSAAAVIYGPDHLTDSMSPGARARALATTLRVQAAEGLRIGGRRSRPQQRLPFIDSAVEQVLETAQPVALVDLSGHPSFGYGANDGSKEADADTAVPCLDGVLPAPYHALLVVPIRVHDGLYGCLLLFYSQPHHFVAEDVALAQAFADQVAQVIMNARLQAQLEQEAAAAERNHLARELHDTVKQELFSASLLAESLPMVWRTHRAEAEAGMRQLHALTQGALAGLDALLLELRPVALEQSPLSEALRKLGAAMSTRAGVPIVVEVDGDANVEPPLPATVKVAFYRVAQESLMNAAKYAKARTIRMQLRANGARGKRRLELEIADDGRGFDPVAIPAGHFGLAIMHERAQAVGASMQVRSRAGQGTVVVMSWRSDRKAAAPERAVSAAIAVGENS